MTVLVCVSLNYSVASKNLALDVYPALSLAEVRQRRHEAREQAPDGIDPSAAQHKDTQNRAKSSLHTVKAAALEWQAIKAKPGQQSSCASGWRSFKSMFSQPSAVFQLWM